MFVGTKQGRSTSRKQPPPTSIIEQIKLLWSANEAKPTPTTLVPSQICKQEVAGSIPAGSIRRQLQRISGTLSTVVEPL